MTVIAAVLLTDRKPAFPVALEYLVNEPLVEKIYINIQTTRPWTYGRIVEFMLASGKPFNIDYWEVKSDWIQEPQYDQDNARFMPIAQGRNMALDWAIVQCMMNQDTSHLLFVDSDVRPHAGGLQKLLDLNKPLSGGRVPGRGAHRHAWYVYHPQEETADVIKCIHGTSGYLLLQRSIFEVARFRAGPCVYERGTFLCDDPALATDLIHFGLADGWYIHKGATADHVDDPGQPLTLEGAINDYHGPPTR